MKLATNYVLRYPERIVRETKAKARLMISMSNDALELLDAWERVVRKFDGKVYNIKFDRAFKEEVKPLIANNQNYATVFNKMRYDVYPSQTCACMSASIKKVECVRTSENSCYDVRANNFWLEDIFLHDDKSKRINYASIMEKIEEQRNRMVNYKEANAKVILMTDEELQNLVLGLNERILEFNTYVDALPKVMLEAINN